MSDDFAFNLRPRLALISYFYSTDINNTLPLPPPAVSSPFKVSTLLSRLL